MAIIFQSNYLVNKEFVYEIVVLLSINTLACYYLMNEIDKAVVKNHKNEQIVQQLAQIQAQNIQLSRQYKLAFDVIHSENSFFTDLSQKKLTHSELMQLFEQRLTKINKILLEWGNPDQINNIQTVFDYFVQQAHAKNIEVVVNGQAEPIFKKKEAFLDIMTILTIILSNAIEHASDSKEHFLGINYLQNSHGALYTVTNSFTPNFKLKDYSLDALVQSGLDLRQVQKLVEELDGEVTTSAKDNFFKIEIQIPNN
ncbi:GHKL domain-containing protein [Lactobacillus bombi]|nr:GHKL domain-containing protein [Bombilactobacillus bombi]